MASEPVLDFDALLRPISEERPTGPYLRDEALVATFYDMRDAANKARGAEKAVREHLPPLDGSEDLDRPSAPDWTVVVDLATDILAHKSKDLWVVSWLIEGLCREHGFAGLRDGFRLFRELCNRYWETLHPGADGTGLDARVVLLAGLNGDDKEGVLVGAIRAIPITEGRTVGPFSLVDYLVAQELDREKDAERRRLRIEAGTVPLDQFEKSVSESSEEFLTGLLADVDGAVEEFQELINRLDELCKLPDSGKSFAPPSSNIANALQQCRDRVALYIKGSVSGKSPDASTLSAPPGTSEVPNAGTTGAVGSRDEAFRILLKLADFFERTEPHSPVSYGLRQIVRWGRLTLPELLMQLIDDRESRDRLFRQIGIEYRYEEEAP